MAEAAAEAGALGVLAAAAAMHPALAMNAKPAATAAARADVAGRYGGNF